MLVHPSCNVSVLGTNSHELLTGFSNNHIETSFVFSLVQVQIHLHTYITPDSFCSFYQVLRQRKDLEACHSFVHSFFKENCYFSMEILDLRTQLLGIAELDLS